MAATFVVYIDESGDEGFAFNKGSSEWFVLSAIITRKIDDLKTVKLVDKVRAQLGKPPQTPLHFIQMKHEQRVPYIAEIAKANLRTVTVIVHKPSLLEPEKFQERYRLYYYTARYLLERVSWYCRDNRTKHDTGDGSANIEFSNRAGMSYKELKVYLDKLKESTTPLGVSIDWSVIKSAQVKALKAENRMGLQIADAVASSFFWAVRKLHGFNEDRYVRMLKQVVYHREGKYLGYGIKFWPRETDEMLKGEESLRWVWEVYK
jgi:hypothetical protein